jgi:hypothetical protein
VVLGVLATLMAGASAGRAMHFMRTGGPPSALPDMLTFLALTTLLLFFAERQFFLTRRQRAAHLLFAGGVVGTWALGGLSGCTLGTVLSVVAAGFFLKPLLAGNHREEGLSQ